MRVTNSLAKTVEVLMPARFGASHATDRTNFFIAPEARAMGAGGQLFARRKDGGEFPVEIGLNPIQTPQGLLVLANVVDISARLAAEEETRRIGSRSSFWAGSACLAR